MDQIVWLLVFSNIPLDCLAKYVNLGPVGAFIAVLLPKPECRAWRRGNFILKKGSGKEIKV
jgi:hypothetical protein